MTSRTRASRRHRFRRCLPRRLLRTTTWVHRQWLKIATSPYHAPLPIGNTSTPTSPPSIHPVLSLQARDRNLWERTRVAFARRRAERPPDGGRGHPNNRFCSLVDGRVACNVPFAVTRVVDGFFFFHLVPSTVYVSRKEKHLRDKIKRIVFSHFTKKSNIVVHLWMECERTNNSNTQVRNWNRNENRSRAK